MERRKLLTRIFEPHAASPGVGRYTNAVLRTQDNEEVKFYDDLIRGKQVVVNFMYADCQGSCPIATQKLKSAYDTLKDRMGKNLFFYSITIRPETDTPAALKHYAQKHKADLPGWYFLTGDPYDIQTLKFRLMGMGHPGFDLQDVHSGMLRIINDNRNSWGMAQGLASQKHILQHISWHDPQKSYAEMVVEYRTTAATPAKSTNPDWPAHVRMMRDALGAALARLAPRDRLRLTCYYVQELTLAQIGKALGEHEATVSRHLARTRKIIREQVEGELRAQGLSPAEMAECFATVVEDAGPLDLVELLGPDATRKELVEDRSQ